jgi:hypothetical protein
MVSPHSPCPQDSPITPCLCWAVGGAVNAGGGCSTGKGYGDTQNTLATDKEDTHAAVGAG